MTNVSADTWVRTIVLIVALLNQVLIATGKKPIPVSDDELYTTISSVATVSASVWAWWKNNSFTTNAIEADEVLTEFKNREPDVSTESDKCAQSEGNIKSRGQKRTNKECEESAN